MARKITKRVNHSFKCRHFNIRIISYSFYEELLGADGIMSVEITDLNDGLSVKIKIGVFDRYGWDWYSNTPNLHIMEDVIKKEISNIK